MWIVIVLAELYFRQSVPLLICMTALSSFIHHFPFLKEIRNQVIWRRKWQPAPVFLPRKSRGQRSLVGHSPWHYRESDMTECTQTFIPYSYWSTIYWEICIKLSYRKCWLLNGSCNSFNFKFHMFWSNRIKWKYFWHFI